MIRGLIETSLIDWDGKITTVLFFDRCNFQCPFCQNWEIILQPERFPIIPWPEIEKRLQKRKVWIDGVVLTGGEPLIYKREVFDISQRLKRLGFRVKLDTNGAFPDRLKELIDKRLVDYVAMDIKAPLDNSYFKAVGRDVKTSPNSSVGRQQDLSLLRRLKRSLNLLLIGNIDYEFRTTCVPGIIDEAVIEKIGVEIRGAKRWFLQVFVPENAYNEEYRTRQISLIELQRLLTIAQRYVPAAQLRGKAERDQLRSG